MPSSNPTKGDVHVNAPLTNISIAYLQQLDHFVATQVFPLVPSDKQSNMYYSFPKDAWMRSQAEPRAPGTESAGGAFTIDKTGTFFCKPYAFHWDIDDGMRANEDAPLQLDTTGTEFVSRACVRRRENDFVSNYFTTGVWTGSTSGSDITPATKWDASGATPIKDIRAQITSILKKTGYMPNTLLLSHQTWSGIQDAADFIDRIAVDKRKVVTKDLLAEVLELDRVIIARAVQETANEGATSAMDFLFGDDAFLCYAAPSPSRMAPSAGYVFSWTGLLGATPQGHRIKKFRMEPIASDRIEGEMAYDMKLVASDMGVFFDDTMT